MYIALQRLIIISFDGMRWDYLDKFGISKNYKNFEYLRQNGVRTEYLKSQFVSKTFPNHWTIATGLFQGQNLS